MIELFLSSYGMMISTLGRNSRQAGSNPLCLASQATSQPDNWQASRSVFVSFIILPWRFKHHLEIKQSITHQAINISGRSKKHRHQAIDTITGRSTSPGDLKIKITGRSTPSPGDPIASPPGDQRHQEILERITTGRSTSPGDPGATPSSDRHHQAIRRQHHQAIDITRRSTSPGTQHHLAIRGHRHQAISISKRSTSPGIQHHLAIREHRRQVINIPSMLNLKYPHFVAFFNHLLGPFRKMSKRNLAPTA